MRYLGREMECLSIMLKEGDAWLAELADVLGEPVARSSRNDGELTHRPKKGSADPDASFVISEPNNTPVSGEAFMF